MIFAMTKEQYIKITEPLRSNPEQGEPCDESESYADSTGILRVSALPFHAVCGQRSMALARRYLFRQCPLWDFPLSGKSSMRPDRMKNLTCRRYWKKKTQKENHFQAGMYFLFLLLR